MPQQPEKQLVTRSIVGGIFMGMANLVPGISGGTMLLASGVYTRFIEAIADITSLKFRRSSLLVLTSVGSAAVLAILIFAGIVKNLVLDARWIMYSLFIGLTLGGVPIIKRLLGRIEPQLWPAIAAGVLLMLAISVFQSGETSSTIESLSWGMMFFAGAAGASAMILPGISGGYLLLVMGAYIPILHGVDQLKSGLRAVDLNLIWTVLQTVVIPVGLGIVFGIVVVSHALKWLLKHFARPTYAVLLGLLVGAVFGLWPFQKMVSFDKVTEIKAQKVHVVGSELVYVDSNKFVEVKDIPVEMYLPDTLSALGALGLILCGFGITLLVARLGREDETL